MQGPEQAEVSAALARVFARREFAEREVPALLQLVRDVWRAVQRWIGSMLNRLLPGEWHPALSWLIIGILVLGAGWALYQLVRAVADPHSPAEPAVSVRAPDLVSRDVGWWEAAARTAAAEGRYRDAALALYLAAVLRLDEKGVLRYHAGKTPGDYRREVRNNAAARSPFDRFVRLLLPVAFGARHPDARAFEALRTSAAELGVHA